MKYLSRYAASTLALISTTVAWQVGEPVSTTSGLLVGHAAMRNREVSEYLGIRYAMAYDRISLEATHD
jgi:hypothetical protein